MTDTALSSGRLLPSGHLTQNYDWRLYALISLTFEWWGYWEPLVQIHQYAVVHALIWVEKFRVNGSLLIYSPSSLWVPLFWMSIPLAPFTDLQCSECYVT